MALNSKGNNSRSDFASYIESYVMDWKDILSGPRFGFPTSKYLRSKESVVLYLTDLFHAIENYIDQNSNDAKVTLEYENEVRKFALSITVALLREWDDLSVKREYRKLLAQRHIAYNIYSSLKDGKINILFFQDNLILFGEIYAGLVEFYDHFYGRFSDNEEAIELLCRYYPKRLPRFLTKERVAEVLYPHISNAGTSGTLGFAYNGIEIIKKTIGNLPETVVKKLLLQYHLFDIIHRDIYRQQIFTIIRYSAIEEKEKVKLKFMSLDFILLANQINQMLIKVFEDKYSYVEPHYLGYEERTGNQEMHVFGYPLAYWKKQEDRMEFILEDVPYLRIELQQNIGISNLLENKHVVISFDYDDWKLDNLNSKEVGKMLIELISKEEKSLVYKYMVFSMLYLNNYRGMEHQLVNFDHDFSYDYIEKQIQKNNIVLSGIEHFYGKNVYSLSCVVGKNGTGKTSIVDFLRESFFKMLKLIEIGIISCEQGCVLEVEYEEYGAFDSGAEFLVVFKLDKETYYLTNIKIKDNEKLDIKPYGRNIHIGINEFSKVVYFSNMLKANQQELYNDIPNITIPDGENNLEISKALDEFRQIDYSETESFIKRRRGMEAEGNFVNRDLCYQFTMLRNFSKEKLLEYFDLDEDKVFFISDIYADISQEGFSLLDLVDENPESRQKINMLEKEYIHWPNVWLRHFSSGQYAKFSFLAKLYWFLEGYIKEKSYYESFIDKNEFSMQEVLGEEDTALIFIDEGELFYHPEWQRRYINTLLELIDRVRRKVKLQIVITTNSPFILSDVLKEDVIYLNKKNNSLKKYESPLGQNIHKLLKDNFFMDYTIGEYGKRLIQNLIEGMQPEDNSKEILEKTLRVYFSKEIEDVVAVKRLIAQVGETVYRQSLDELAKEYFQGNEEDEIQYIEEKIKELQAKVEQKKKVLKEGK